MPSWGLSEVGVQPLSWGVFLGPHCGAQLPLSDPTGSQDSKSSSGANGQIGRGALFQIPKTGDPHTYSGEMGWISDNEFGVTQAPPAKFWVFASPRS